MAVESIVTRLMVLHFDRATELSSPDASANDRGLRRLRLLLDLLEPTDSESRINSAVHGAETRHADNHERPLLGRFDLFEHVGSGGFGLVVRARDRLLHRKVALKMPLPERLLSPHDLERFLRDARMERVWPHAATTGPSS